MVCGRTHETGRDAVPVGADRASEWARARRRRRRHGGASGGEARRVTVGGASGAEPCGAVPLSPTTQPGADRTGGGGHRWV